MMMRHQTNCNTIRTLINGCSSGGQLFTCGALGPDVFVIEGDDGEGEEVEEEEEERLYFYTVNHCLAG